MVDWFEMVVNFLLQVEIPEELESDDEAEKKKWKWKVKSVKKENRERYSLRCDTELKLAVCFLDIHVYCLVVSIFCRATHSLISMVAGST